MIDIGRFKEVRILVAGDVMLDRYCWGTVSRISPEAPVPIVRLDRTTSVAGGAANVAVNVARLGARCSIAGAVGSDSNGATLIALLNENQVETECLFALPDRPTAIKTRIIAHSQQVVRLDEEDVTTFSRENVETIIAGLEGCLDEFDLVILSDYAKGFLNNDVLSYILSEKFGLVPVLVDPKGKDFTKYSGAFMMTPNRNEALEACKMDGSEQEATHASGKTLLETTNIDNILVTEGENGMTLFRKDLEPVHIAASHQEVYDVTGAGDTVIACLGVATAAGFETAAACQIANIAAGVAVGKIGTHPVSFEELADALVNDPTNVGK